MDRLPRRLREDRRAPLAPLGLAGLAGLGLPGRPSRQLGALMGGRCGANDRSGGDLGAGRGRELFQKENCGFSPLAGSGG